jgi:condensin complex subunit 2
LQLTENLKDVLESQNNNFQTAASAIDASVKIFAARVDSVHQETFKLQSGLNRTDGGAMGREESSPAPGEAEERQPEKPVKRKGRLASTLVKSAAEIDAGAFEMQYEEDPLIKKASAAFDSGTGR